MPNSPIVNRRVIFQGVNYDSILIDWINELRRRSYTVPSAFYLNTLNRYIVTNRANLLLRDRFYIFAQQSGCQQAATISLINPTSTPLVEVNSPTWTANQGYTGNGTSMYLNTKYNPSTHAVKLAQNNANMDLYTRNTIVAGLKFVAGGIAGSSSIVLALNYTGFGKLWAANAAGQSINANSTTFGLYSDTRAAASGASATILYRNGSSLATDTTASTALVNAEMFVMAFSNSGTPSNYDTNQYSRWSIGASIGMNYTLDYTSWQMFANTIGFAV